MMGVWTVSLALSCSLLLSDADASTSCRYYAAAGEPYHIPLEADSTLGSRTIWMKSNAKVYDSKMKTNRFEVTKEKSLILPKVSSDDAGTYTWESLSDGTQVGKKSVELCVQDKVPKPKVKISCGEKIQFTCSVPQQPDVTYHWLEGSNVLASEKAAILIRTSKQLGSNLFSCKVSNAISSETSDPAQQTCFPTNKEEDKLLLGLDFWLMIGILAGGGGLVLVLIVATIVCCTINRKKRRVRMKDEQELRLQWSTGPNQRLPNPDYANQRSPAHSYGHPANKPTPRATAEHGHGPARDPPGNTGPKPPRARQNRPRPPDPITGQPLPGPRRLPETEKSQVNEEENPPPLPQPRKKAQQRTQRH